MIWFDNWYCRKFTNDPLAADRSLNCTAEAVLHTFNLGAYPGYPDINALKDRIPAVQSHLKDAAAGLKRAVASITGGPIPRSTVRCPPLDIPRSSVLGLQWKPMAISPLRTGTTLDLLMLPKGMRDLQPHTAHCLPLLLDEKIFYYVLKFQFSATYVD